MNTGLPKQDIPKAFIDNLPEGLKIVSRRGNTYVVVEELTCPNDHSLLSDFVRIHGEPAISVDLKGGGAEGKIYLDPFWGLHTKLFDFMFKNAEERPLVKAFCPECGVSLMIPRRCDYPGCKAHEYIQFNLPDGKNRIYACAEWGCPEHDMMVTSIPGEVSKAVQRINFPDLHTNSEAIGF